MMLLADQNEISRIRYEAFCGFASSVARVRSTGELARVVARKLKYVVDAAVARITIFYPDEIISFQLIGGKCQILRDNVDPLIAVERKFVEDGRPRTLTRDAITSFPELSSSPLCDERVVELKVTPSSGQEHPQCMLLGSTRKSELADIDHRFARLAGELIDTKMSQLMLDETLEERNRELHVALELAQAADKEKARFMSTISHEIRTPMNGVIGMTELLLDTPLTSEQREYCQIVHDSGRTLLVLINQILDFSLTQSGKLILDQRPMSPRRCVEETLGILAEQASRKGLELLCAINPNVPDVVLGDENRVRQVLLNLVGNAIKFASEGEVTVHMDVVSTSGDQQPRVVNILLEVNDTGIGISAEQQEKIFKPFQQGDASISHLYGGTGLGLTICDRIMRAMGSRLCLESEPGKGSRFHMTIPFKVAEQSLSNASGPRSENDHLQGYRVLIISSNKSLRDMLSSLCREWQMLVHAVSCDEDARTEMNAADFDAAIVNTPPDGGDTRNGIRSENPFHSLPLVLLRPVSISLDTLPADHELQWVISKPVRKLALMNALTQAVNCARPPIAVPTSPPVELARYHRPGKSTSLRILIAEDNPVNQRVIVHMLRRYGYDADVVDNGREAVEAVERSHYDLVFMDVQMPVLDGLQAAREINQLFTKPDRPRLIALTANVMVESRQECIDAGMDDYLAKPVQSAELSEKLRQAAATKANLHRSSARRQRKGAS